jgi:hypothetical protein
MFRAATVRTYQEFSRSTGRQLGEALQKELHQAPDACWLFCAPLSGMEDLLKGICEGLGSDRIIGCTTSGEISSRGLSINSAVLGGIVTDRIDFEMIAVENLSAGSSAAGRKLASSFSSAPRYLQIFSDGLTGNGCAILRGIADVLGNDLPVTGGAAGDNGEFRQTLQFSRGRIYQDALCGIAFHGDFRLGTGVSSGWAPIGLAKQVTKARGKVVYELNGEPALNVFERFLGQHAEKLPAIGVEYPLGFTMPSQNTNQKKHYVLRATMSVDRKERSITFAGEIPEGALVNLTCGDKPSILAAADTAAKEAKTAIGDANPEIIFCYSCMARKIVLGGRTKEEIERIQKGIGDQIPMIGFYSYGEFCPIGAVPCNHLHNETITLSVLGLTP